MKTEGSLRKHLDIARLELKNRFAVFADTNKERDVDANWKKIEETYAETTTTVLVFRKKRNKK